MGGFEDKTRPNTGDSAPRLYVRGFVMMGAWRSRTLGIDRYATLETDMRHLK